MERVERYFQLKERKSTLRKEAFAGFVCFIANAYQLVLIPAIMHNGGAGLPKPTYLFAFAIVTAFSSFLVGAASNLPVPMGVGIGCTTVRAQKRPNSNSHVLPALMCMCMLVHVLCRSILSMA